MMYISYLFLTIVKWTKHMDTPTLCIFEGIVIQYSKMSMYFWLSAIGFNVWSSFRKMKPRVTFHTRRQMLGFQDKSFKWYALYAWGCPFLVTCVTLTMQFLPESEAYVLPKIGNRTCTLDPEWGKLYYYHVINGPILVSINHYF